MRAWMGGLIAAVPLAGCGGTTPPPMVSPAPAARTYAASGLDRVIGKDAAQLTGLFGKADADLREGDARRLQFAGPFCVLDAYLYPRGHNAPVVTYIDTRQPNGSPIDRASCIAALTRRGGGR